MQAACGLVTVGSGCRREPPPNAGEPEKPYELAAAALASSSAATAVADGAPGPALDARDDTTGPRAATCPNGSAVVANPRACTLTLVARDGQRWTRSLPACRDVLAPAVAADSMIYARSSDLLIAFSLDGAEVWRTPLPETRPPLLGAPTTTRDSLVVLATSPTSVAAYTGKGTRAWEMRLPADEPLTTAPTASGTEGVTLVTSTAVYFVGADGSLRARRPHVQPP
jgi:hypothetical protein